MIGLTDTQLAIVMGAARKVPVEKRDTFLQRIAAMLALRGAAASPTPMWRRLRSWRCQYRD
jgi:hypothetical protein